MVIYLKWVWGMTRKHQNASLLLEKPKTFFASLETRKKQILSMFFDTENTSFHVTNKIFHTCWFYAENVTATYYGYGGWTRTPRGIDAAVGEFKKDGRSNVPKLLIVITDGAANGGGSVLGSSNAARFYIYGYYCYLQDVHTVCNVLTLFCSSPWTRFLRFSAKERFHCQNHKYAKNMLVHAPACIFWRVQRL